MQNKFTTSFKRLLRFRSLNTESYDVSSYKHEEITLFRILLQQYKISPL